MKMGFALACLVGFFSCVSVSNAVDPAPAVEALRSILSDISVPQDSTDRRVGNFPLEIEPDQVQVTPGASVDPKLTASIENLQSIAPKLDIATLFTQSLAAQNPLNPFLFQLRATNPGTITVRFDTDPRLTCLKAPRATLSRMPKDAHLAVVAYYPPAPESDLEWQRVLKELDEACEDRTQSRGIEPVYNAQLFVQNESGNWIRALETTQGLDGVLLSQKLIQEKHFRYKLNGLPIGRLLSRPVDSTGSDGTPGYLFGSGALGTYHFEVIPTHEGCRSDINAPPSIDLVLGEPAFNKARYVANGITVGAPKIYDTFTLRQMLNTTAAQLASISGFSQSQIFTQLGTFQGITRDTSYLAAQVTATPTPTVSMTNSAGTTGQNTNSINTVGNVGGSSSIVTMQCPAGTVPSISTGGSAQSCTAPILNAGTGSSPTVLAAGNISGNTAQQTNLGGNSSLQTTLNNGTVQNTSQQGQTTINSGGYAGTVPTAPAASALTPPSNVGLSAGDSLVEQVQLNSQITNLRLMLQGALSDQYLARSTQAVAARAQTTLGFSVSLDPPRQYKGAVAEVRIIVVSPKRAGEVSVVNLLPAAKTYNVAKVTSRQSSFGAGVIVDTVNVGVNTGRSKDRLYLAKDTDTVALEYPSESWRSLDRPFPQYVADLGREIERWLTLGHCSEDVPEPVGQDVKVFGWQFRPVLGAAYVQSGERQVYAQLALPTTVTQAYAPYVYVQTRWRTYNANKQVVGAAFEGSCTTVRVQDAVTMQNPIQVDDIRATDVGGAVTQLHVTGRFFSPGISAVAGPIAIPVFTSDGHSLDLFANTSTLLQTGPIQLMQEDGTVVPLGIRTTDIEGAQCQLDTAQVVPVPLPDGTSRVSVDLRYGKSYRFDPDHDGSPYPIVMVGNQIFGVQGAPFLHRKGTSEFCQPEKGQVQCHFDFLASTDTLRTAETFTVRDLRWSNLSKSGNLEFEPSFSAIKSLLPPIKEKDKDKVPPPPKGALYLVSGTGFDRIAQLCADDQKAVDCIALFDGTTRMVVDANKIKFDRGSSTTAVLSTDEPLKSTSLRVLWYGRETLPIEWDLSLPKVTAESIVASPALLNVGDSRTVTFSGGEDLAAAIGPTTVPLTFDGGNGSVTLNGTFDKEHGTIKVLIPTLVTQRPGYKELIAMMSLPTLKAPKAVQLPIQVVQGATTITAN